MHDSPGRNQSEMTGPGGMGRGKSELETTSTHQPANDDAQHHATDSVRGVVQPGRHSGEGQQAGHQAHPRTDALMTRPSNFRHGHRGCHVPRWEGPGPFVANQESNGGVLLEGAGSVPDATYCLGDRVHRAN